MSIRKILAVARREFNETVKTKAFLLGILLMPGLIIGLIFISAKVSSDQAKGSGSTLKVAVVDHTQRVAATMSELAGQHKGGDEEAKVEVESVKPAGAEQLAQLKHRVQEGQLFGVVDVPAEAVEGKGTCQFYIQGMGMDGRPWQVQNLITEAVKRIRLADAGLDVARVEALSQPIAVQQQDIREQQGRPGQEMANIMTPFAFLFLLWMGVFGVSQGLLTSVIEEKSSRVVEVLLSALSPLELMAGKILGMAAVGLTMMVLWAGVGYITAMAKHMEHLVQFTNLGQFILYYVLGFLLISAILAAIGSACNTLKDAQPMMLPVTLVLIIPMMLWFNISHSPNGKLALGLSVVPLMTPFVMMLRLTSMQGTVPLWQQLAAPVWVSLWVLVVMWAAGRVFRVGLLMYGKTPGIRELARWVTYK